VLTFTIADRREAEEAVISKTVNAEPCWADGTIALPPAADI